MGAEGDPRHYSCFFYESVNKSIIAIAASCHRMIFERRLFAKAKHLSPTAVGEKGTGGNRLRCSENLAPINHHHAHRHRHPHLTTAHTHPHMPSHSHRNRYDDHDLSLLMHVAQNAFYWVGACSCVYFGASAVGCNIIIHSGDTLAAR